MKVYLVDGRRTPFGKFSGSLKDITPVDLAVACASELISHLNVAPDKIDQTVFANVLPSTTDTLYGGRHISLKLGLPVEKAAYNINRLCGSGIQALWEASNMIRLEQANCVLCTGSENMSLAPHLIYGSRFGTKFGPLKSVDMLMDSLTDQYAGCPMGITAENLAQDYALTREEIDDYAHESHRRSQAAWDRGLMNGEVVQGGLRLAVDEHIRRDGNREELSQLRPSFKKDGFVTAANASGIVDGGAAVMVASEKFVKENSLQPLAELVDFSVVGVDPTRMGIGPVPAIQELLKRLKISVKDIDLFEINEAFAPQVLACQKALELDAQKLNIWGGAIAYGHPLGASGLRISHTLARQLKNDKKTMGIAAACIGGGQGIAVALRAI